MRFIELCSPPAWGDGGWTEAVAGGRSRGSSAAARCGARAPLSMGGGKGLCTALRRRRRRMATGLVTQTVVYVENFGMTRGEQYKVRRARVKKRECERTADQR
jgi:hypothetical protein